MASPPALRALPKRLPKEPPHWYQRFLAFYLPATPHTLHSAYLAWRADEGKPHRARVGVPQSWRDAAEKWNWEKRASTWDLAVAELRFTEEEEGRTENRGKRRNLLGKLGNVLAEALENIDSQELSKAIARNPWFLLHATVGITREMRTEWELVGNGAGSLGGEEAGGITRVVEEGDWRSDPQLTGEVPEEPIGESPI